MSPRAQGIEALCALRHALHSSWTKRSSTSAHYSVLTDTERSVIEGFRRHGSCPGHGRRRCQSRSARPRDNRSCTMVSLQMRTRET